MANSAKTASGCLILFSAPFILGGLLFAIVSYRSLNDPTFKNPIVGICVGFALFVIGLLILAAGRKSLKTQKQLEVVKSTYPDQPWMWRSDWASGRATGLTGGSLLMTWTATIFWNAMSWGSLYSVVYHPAHRQPKAVVLFLAVFSMIGAALLVWAMLQTLRLLRFGRTFLRLQTVPAALGGLFRGTIDVRLPYPTPHGIKLTFSCINRVTSGTGNSRSTSDHIRWQDTRNVPAEQIIASPSIATIPVDFEVPRNLPPSDNSDVNNQILWLVQAEADIPGANFDERYEVPVFQTRDSPTIAEWQSKQESEMRSHSPLPPVNPTVLVNPAPEGGTQFYFPAGRNKSAAAGITFFTFLFGGVLVAIFLFKAPLIFPIVFGFFVLLLLVITLNLWFGTARIVADSSGVSLHTSTLGLRGSKHWDTDQIRIIYPKITMQSGGRAYYTITITDSSGRDYSMGNAIGDHNEAEWICSQIRELTDLHAKSTVG